MEKLNILQTNIGKQIKKQSINCLKETSLNSQIFSTFENGMTFATINGEEEDKILKIKATQAFFLTKEIENNDFQEENFHHLKINNLEVLNMPSFLNAPKNKTKRSLPDTDRIEDNEFLNFSKIKKIRKVKSLFDIQIKKGFL